MKLTYGPLRTVVNIAGGGWDKDGHGRGMVITEIKDESSGRSFGDVTLGWQVDSLGLRITQLHADHITADLLRLPFGAIVADIRDMFRKHPERASGPLTLAKFGATFTPEERVVVKEHARRVRERSEHLSEAHIQRSGRRENEKTKFKYADWYLECVARYDQRAIKGLEKELREYGAEEEISALPASSLSTKMKRYRQAEWLMEAIPGRAGGGPGPKMIEYAKKHNPERLPQLLRQRDEWQVVLDHKAEEDPKYRIDRKK